MCLESETFMKHLWNLLKLSKYLWDSLRIFEIDFEWFWNILNMFELFCDVLSKFWGDVGKVGIRWYQYHGSREVRRFVCLWANLGSGNEHLDPRGSGLVLYFRAAVFQLGFQIAHNDFPEAPRGHVAWYGSVVISMLSVVYLFGLQGFPMFSQVFFGYSKSVCQFFAFFLGFRCQPKCPAQDDYLHLVVLLGSRPSETNPFGVEHEETGGNGMKWKEHETNCDLLWILVLHGGAWVPARSYQKLQRTLRNSDRKKYKDSGHTLAWVQWEENAWLLNMFFFNHKTS